MMPLSPAEKFREFKDRILFDCLEPEGRSFFKRICLRYAWTYQEMKQLAEMARDLEMWRTSSFREIWDDLETRVPEGRGTHERKKFLFAALRERLNELRRVPKKYPAKPVRDRRETKRLSMRNTEGPVFGDCPVASPKTVCCCLKTIDAVENCPYGCSYCTIQTFYGKRVFFRTGLKAALHKIRLIPGRFYHFGTGQSSDSLVWGNRYGMLDDLCAFAAAHPDILLEFKTKSANIAYFLKTQVPRNVVCSWSLNPETIIRHEEPGTAGLCERLEAAERVAARGMKVAFHFHPIVYYEGWMRDYESLAAKVLEKFHPREVLFISFGTVTFIKPVLRAIRERGGFSKILQMEMVPDPHGKLTYPASVKLELFGGLVDAFAPWKDRVYQYLCMEDAYYWDRIFGRHYPSNEAFEADFGRQVMRKIRE